jgi:rhodanese-related sulfurtransferase
MDKVKILLSSFLLLIVFFSGAALAANGFKEINAAGVKKFMDKGDALVVFPLSPIEFAHKHIKGSVNIIPAMMEYELPTNKGKTVIFYCLGIKCVASLRAAKKAVSLGYKNVYAFREGLPGWENAGYPLVSTKKLPDVEIKKISTEELSQMLYSKDIILLDINLEEDANNFYVDNAKRIHIPLDELNVSLPQLPKKKKIAVMCLKGERSGTAVKYLIGQGYDDVVIVDGGLQKWVLEGRPIKQEVASK